MHRTRDNPVIDDALQALHPKMFVDQAGLRWMSSQAFLVWLFERERVTDTKLQDEIAHAAFHEFHTHPQRPPRAVMFRSMVPTDALSTPVVWENTSDALLLARTSGSAPESVDASFATEQRAKPEAEAESGVAVELESGTSTPDCPPPRSADTTGAVAAVPTARPARQARALCTAVWCFNLFGFLFFVRCLKVLTTGYTVIDELHRQGAALARTLFSPDMADMRSCLNVDVSAAPETSPGDHGARLASGAASRAASGGPPNTPSMRAPSGAASGPAAIQSKLSFAPSAAPRHPGGSGPSSRVQGPPSTSAGAGTGTGTGHPYARTVTAATAAAAAAAEATAMPPRAPLASWGALRGRVYEWVAPMERCFASVSLPPSSRQLVRSNREVALEILEHLRSFRPLPNAPAPVGAPTLEALRSALRAVLSDVRQNATLLLALREGRLSAAQFLAMDRRKPVVGAPASSSNKAAQTK